MKRIVFVVSVLVCVGWSGSAFAQTVVATPNSRYGWDQDAPDLATAQSYTYKIYLDGSATGAVTAATCTGTATPFACTSVTLGTLFPSMTAGNHSFAATASDAAGESLPSAAFAYKLVTVPAAPKNPRIVG